MRCLAPTRPATTKDSQFILNGGGCTLAAQPGKLSSRGPGGRGRGGRTTHEGPITPATCAAFRRGRTRPNPATPDPPALLLLSPSPGPAPLRLLRAFLCLFLDLLAASFAGYSELLQIPASFPVVSRVF